MPRTLLATLGVPALAFGAASLLAPRAVQRFAEPRPSAGGRWALRMFAVRDLALGLACLSVARSGNRSQAHLLASIVTALQVGDLAVSSAAAARGDITRRGAAFVWLGAPPALAASVALAVASRDTHPTGS